jgi:hypothetical protein
MRVRVIIDKTYYTLIYEGGGGGNSRENIIIEKGGGGGNNRETLLFSPSPPSYMRVGVRGIIMFLYYSPHPHLSLLFPPPPPSYTQYVFSIIPPTLYEGGGEGNTTER